MTGAVNLCKPPGLTSQQAVARVRRLAGVKRAGHAGTLDPEAAGVLPVCVGSATRIAEYLMSRPKTYRALIQFGLGTDTDDAEGQVVATGPVPAPGAVEAALPQFVGDIQQVPPVYSALKRQGRPAYALARAGKPVEMAPRRVHVASLRVVGWEQSAVWLDVVCGSGFYVRALARDLGSAVGTAAHLGVLIRTSCGGFGLDQSLGLEELQANGVEGALVAMADALGFLPRRVLGASEAERVRAGWQPPGLSPDRVALVDPLGALVAVASDGRLEKVLG